MTTTRSGAARRPAMRKGFTLVELIIVLGVLAVLSAVVVSQLLPRIGESQSAALAQNLDALNDAIAEFRGDVGRYPGQLYHLSNPPAAGSLDPCGRAIPSQFLAEWAGPYLQRPVQTSGIPSGDATIQNALARDPATPAGFGMLLITVVNVDRSVADDIETAFDGNANLADGAVRWVEVGTGTARGTLTFAIPIRGC